MQEHSLLPTAPTEAGHSPSLYSPLQLRRDTVQSFTAPVDVAHSPIFISPFLQRRDTVTFFIHSSRWGRTQSHPLLIAPAAAGHSPILYLPLLLRRDTVPAWRWSLWIFRPQEAPADPARVPWERWRCCCWLLPAAVCPEWRPCVAPPPPARARRPSNSHKPQTAVSTTFSHQHNHTQATDCRQYNVLTPTQPYTGHRLPSVQRSHTNTTIHRPQTAVSTTSSHQHNHTQATDCRIVSTTSSHQHNHTQATDCRIVSTTSSHQHNHTQATDCRIVSTTSSHQRNHRAPACTTTVNDLLKRTVITTWL